MVGKAVRLLGEAGKARQTRKKEAGKSRWGMSE